LHVISNILASMTCTYYVGMADHSHCFRTRITFHSFYTGENIAYSFANVVIYWLKYNLMIVNIY